MIINKLKESSTFVLVVIALVVINYQWIFGNVESTLREYAESVALVMTVWLGREWRKNHYDNKDG